MLVNTEQCVGCGLCVPHCVVGAIHVDNHKAVINQELCVECNSCRKANVCKKDALYMPELGWPRILRWQYSDPNAEHPKTKMGGRGTYEIKTNDVTGRIKKGKVGVVVEMGRPGVGTSFVDVEKMTKALAPTGAEFEAANPLTSLFDNETGVFKEDVLSERVLSCIIEMNMPLEKLDAVLTAILETANKIDTVFSLGFLSTYDSDGSLIGLDIVKRHGIVPKSHAKYNLGMGRPLYKDLED